MRKSRFFQTLAWLVLALAPGPLTATVSDRELDEIHRYLSLRHLEGTWKERAIRAFIRMENSGRWELRSEEVRPEFIWMGKWLRDANPPGPEVKKLYTDLRRDLKQALQQPYMSFDLLYYSLAVFADAFLLRHAPLVVSYPFLEDWRRRGGVANMHFAPYLQSRRVVLWPVLPGQKDRVGLQLSAEDFVDLLPFPIIPLELCLQDRVRYDDIIGTPANALSHDLNHGHQIEGSWIADLAVLGEYGQSSADYEKMTAFLRRLRRELVLGLHARFAPPFFHKLVAPVLFNIFHEQGAPVLWIKHRHYNGIHPVRWLGYLYLVRPLRKQCARLLGEQRLLDLRKASGY